MASAFCILNSMEPLSKKTVSVIIVTYFSEHEIRGCLDAVMEPSDRTIELIVIDNVSKDKTVEILRTEYSNRPNVRLVFNTENTGFAKGNNQGANLATGEYILILNPDTIAPAATIAKLADYLDAHPSVGVVGPRITDENGVVQESYGDELTPWNELVGKTMYSKYAEKIPFVRTWKKRMLESDHVAEVGWIGGACAMFRRELFMDVGGIDETFFLSHGDMPDLGKRINARGFKAVLYPHVSIVHTGSKSVAQDRDEALRTSYIGTLYLFKKYYGPGTVFLAKCVYVFASLVKGLLALPISLFKRDPYRAIAWSHFNNAWRIITGTLGTIS